MTNIVYQAYGKKEILYQTIYSLFSILDFPQENKNFRIVIYTDQIDFLKKYFAEEPCVHYELLTQEKMAKWKGAINFNHRMKIEVLKDCGQKYDGNILYLDGDTYFVKNVDHAISKITETQGVMHLPEHQLNKTKDILAKKLYQFLKKNPITVKTKEIILPKDFVMWNAGVIGLHRKHFGLFDWIISYTDELYSRYPKHVMEQYAVSYFLQSIGPVLRTDDVIEHYWNQKDSFEEAIVPFFEKNQTAKQFFENRNSLKLPLRYYGIPRYTLKQKMKHKWNRIKNIFGQNV